MLQDRKAECKLAISKEDMPINKQSRRGPQPAYNGNPTLMILTYTLQDCIQNMGLREGNTGFLRCQGEGGGGGGTGQ